MTTSGQRSASVFWAVVTLYAVLLVQVMDASIASVSFLTMARDLRVTDVDGQWIITAFGVGVALAIAASVRVSAWAGPKVLLGYGLAGSVLASLACGLAQDFGQMIASRGMQGVAGGFVIMGGQLLLNELLGSERKPLALGLWTSAISLAPVLGPLAAAGILLDLSWRWLFLVPACITLLGAVVLRRHLRLSADRPGPLPDLIAPALLLVILIASSAVLAPRFDGTLPSRCSATLISAIMIGAWLALSALGKFRSATIFRWQLLRNRSYFTYTSVAVVVNGLLGGTTFVYALWLQVAYALPIVSVAIVIAGGGVVAGVLSPFIANMKNRRCYPALVGGALLLFALASVLTAQVTKTSPYLSVILPRLVLGVALAFFSPAAYLAVADIAEADFLPAYSLGMFLRPAIANVFIAGSAALFGTTVALHSDRYFVGAAVAFAFLGCVVTADALRREAAIRRSLKAREIDVRAPLVSTSAPRVPQRP